MVNPKQSLTFLAILTCLFLTVDSGIAAQKTSVIRDKSTNLQELKDECLKKENLGSCLIVQDKMSKTKTDETELILITQFLCHHNDHPSCVMLGNFARNKYQFKDAIQWYRKACDLEPDHGKSCYEIANIARQEKQPTNVSIWEKKACTRGHTKACPPKE